MGFFKQSVFLYRSPFSLSGNYLVDEVQENKKRSVGKLIFEYIF